MPLSPSGWWLGLIRARLACPLTSENRPATGSSGQVLGFLEALAIFRESAQRSVENYPVNVAVQVRVAVMMPCHGVQIIEQEAP